MHAQQGSVVLRLNIIVIAFSHFSHELLEKLLLGLQEPVSQKGDSRNILVNVVKKLGFIYASLKYDHLTIKSIHYNISSKYY